MTESFEREMSITHNEFYRILPKALASHHYKMQDSVITVSLGEGADNKAVGLKPGTENNEGEIVIILSRETVRKIASLALPLTNVTFKLKNVAEKTKKDFFEQFDRSFLRGGG